MSRDAGGYNAFCFAARLRVLISFFIQSSMIRP